MKRLNAVLRLTFSLATMFAIVFLSQAESGEKRATDATETNCESQHPHFRSKRPAGRQRHALGYWHVFDVAVGQGGDVFVPDTLNISVGDTVRWTWAESGHSVTSGPPCAADSQYCSPDDNNCAAGILSNVGTVYEHTFTEPGSLFLPLRRALRYRHDGRGQCFWRLRAVGLVSRSGHAYGTGQSSWRLFPSRRQLLYHGWPHFGCGGR